MRPLFVLAASFPLLVVLGITSSAVPTQGTWTSGSTGADGALDFGNPGSLPAGLTFFDAAGTVNDYWLFDLSAFPSNYDAANWVMDFHWTTVDVPAGVQVRFANHPSFAPVVWRATGAVNIAGHVNLKGDDGHGFQEVSSWAQPGPGGFRGGRGSLGGWITQTAGFGPGGAGLGNVSLGLAASHQTLGAAGVATPTSAVGRPYGTTSVAPLRGGSGGSAGLPGTAGSPGGGAGGGAICIASDVSVTVNGLINANGGHRGGINAQAGGPGSGGAIRLVSPAIDVGAGGSIRALGGSGNQGAAGGHGYVRIETDPGGLTLDANSNVAPDEVETFVEVLSDVIPSMPPMIEVHAWDGVMFTPVADPRAAYVPAFDADVALGQPGLHPFRIVTRGIPLGTQLLVRTVHTRGDAAIDDSSYTVGMSGGQGGFDYADITLDVAGGVTSIIASAQLP